VGPRLLGLLGLLPAAPWVHPREQYLEQEARNGFEFGLERLLDGIEAYLSRQ